MRIIRAAFLVTAIGTLNSGSNPIVTSTVIPPAIGDFINTSTATGDQSVTNPGKKPATAVTPAGRGSGTPVDVLQHHLHATRDGLYVDPLITQDAATTTHRDLSFDADLTGQRIHAQPLYVNNGPA